MSGLSSVMREDARQASDSLCLEPLSGATLLVTGAAGFLCSALLDLIHAWNARGPGCRVIALDNFSSGLPERVAHLRDDPHFEFVRHDLTRPLALTQRVDYIVHGASIASPPVYRARPLETIDANVAGTRQVLEIAGRGARSVVYLSTSEIYGDPEAEAIPTPETYRGRVSCTGPRACYDESKRLGETLCSVYHRQFGTPVKTVRPFNVYGPGQRLDDGRIVPDLIAAALQRRPIALYSDGRATRAFCYVSDALRALLLVLLSNADGEAFNIGNDDAEIPILELAHLLREVAGPPPLEIRFQDSPDAEYLSDNPQRRRPDLTKLRTHTGYAPRVDLKTGIERTLRSYRELAP